MPQEYEYYWEPKPKKKAKSETFSLRIDAPGFSKDDIKVKIEDGLVHVSAEKSQKEERRGKSFFSRSFSSAAFSNAFSLPEGVETKDLDIQIKDGTVMITRKKR